MCIPRPQRARPRVSASQSPPGRACDATCPIASRLLARRRRRLSLRRRRRRPPRPPPPPPSTLCASPPPPPHHRRSRGRAGRWGTQAERQGCAPLHLRHLRVRLVELRRDQARRRRCVRDAGGAGHRPDADGFGRASAGMRLCGRLSWRAVQREAGADRRGAAPAHRASGVHSRQARCAARCAARGAVYQLEPDPREITESRRSRRSRRSRQMEEREKMEERQIEWRSKGDRTTCRRRRRALAIVKRGHARRRAVRRYRLLEAAAADPL